MCFFGQQKKPDAPPPVTPPPVVPAPNKQATKVDMQGAIDKEKQKMAGAVGQGKTVLTSPLGVVEDPNVKKSTLLGRTSA